MRQKFFVVPFANSGDQTVIPDTTQVSGSVSFPSGWGFNYQRDPDTDALAMDIDRSTMNWLFLAITEQIQQYQEYGAPEWITTTNNDGTPFAYDFGAKVRYSTSGNPPFFTYVSVLPGVGTNTSVPGADANWRLIGCGLADTYNATYQAAIAGYPIKTILLKADGSGYWISTVAANLTNPETGGAGWASFMTSSPQSWGAAQSGIFVPIQPVAAAATLILPFASGNNFIVGANVNGSTNVTHAIAGNFVLGTPSGITPGLCQSGQITFLQDATGGRTITSHSSSWIADSGAFPQLTAGANGRDCFFYSIDYDGKIVVSSVKNPS